MASNISSESKREHKKQLELRRLQNELKEVKQMAIDKGLIPAPVEEVVVVEEPLDKQAIIDEAKEQFKAEAERQRIIDEGITHPAFPGIVFKGKEAELMLDTMGAAPEEKPYEEIGGQLSDEDYADLAEKYFRVDVTQKPKRKNPNGFEMEE